mmetsp:Transcript_44551/g.80671  ORF Transcript_44551/g.80671 Transcript_44551/m.80671 type:complete len:93 (-) Transcript_44551:178-456(-)
MRPFAARPQLPGQVVIPGVEPYGRQTALPKARSGNLTSRSILVEQSRQEPVSWLLCGPLLRDQDLELQLPTDRYPARAWRQCQASVSGGWQI